MSGMKAVLLRFPAVDRAGYAFQTVSRFHWSSQTLFSAHISCRLRHFASLPLANLKGKKGGGGREVKKGFQKGGEEGEETDRYRNIGRITGLARWGGIAGEHM